MCRRGSELGDCSSIDDASSGNGHGGRPNQRGKKAIVASAMTSAEDHTSTEWRHKRNT